jgi:hypothetical protein
MNLRNIYKNNLLYEFDIFSNLGDEFWRRRCDLPPQNARDVAGFCRLLFS